jgi:hypothetical protein
MYTKLEFPGNELSVVQKMLVNDRKETYNALFQYLHDYKDNHFPVN